MKYRKKPVVIDAFCFADNIWPEWFVNAIKDGIVFPDDFKNPQQFFVKTLEGDMIIGKDDYIIKGIAGEIYPCKLDIFEQTYELAE